MLHNHIDMVNDKFTATHEAVSIFKISCAESEKLLNQYYKTNAFVKQAENFNSLKTFFIGRTGIGKTAIIKNIINKSERIPNLKCLTISPEDFIFDIAERNETIKELTNNGVNLGLVYKTLWKTILLTEILKATYGQQKSNWIGKILVLGVEKKALKFLEENNELDGDKSISERVQNLLNRMEHQVSANFSIADRGVKYEGKIPADIKDKINKSIQKFEISELRYFIGKLDSDILRFNRIYIFIDDLDKNWINSDISRKLIGALFESIVDFANLEKIKIIISLRTNLFQQIDLHQPEKYYQFIENIYWSPEDIHNMCHLRINKIFQVDFGSAIYKKIFPDKIHTDNNKSFAFDDYLISRSNLRPRDAIHFLSFIFEEIINKNKASQAEIFRAETKYSIDRLSALYFEWQTPYSNLKDIIDFFSYCPHKMKIEELILILDRIFDYVVQNKENSNFSHGWLIEHKYIDLDRVENIGLISLFYNIGLIGVKKTGAEKIQFNFQHGHEIYNYSKNENAKFYINPCYYKALNVTFHN